MIQEQEARLLSIIRRQIVTEKGTVRHDPNQFLVLEVLRDANKVEVKAAVEMLFKVKVKSVNTLNVKGKTRRTRYGIGQRSDWKKAYVTLEPGQTVDLGAAVKTEESK
ncbi:MAG: 50S ribosomal protein L23 [Succinivibrionaceae bacterium]|nr:50S ribosomal protein L23 [Succinivibrionaceae bacterium]